VLAQLPYLSTHFDNPSSAHGYGQPAPNAVDAARRRLAVVIGADPDEVTFTGSGSERNVLAIRGAILAELGPGRCRRPGPRRASVGPSASHVRPPRSGVSTRRTW
jgi:cysteine desulfurase